MGKPSGFIDWDRRAPEKRPKSERLKDSREIELAVEPMEQSQQAGRCMDCGVPFCHQGCPLGNLIPDFNHAVYKGRWKDAWQALSLTNDFPEFTGRICPAPCEASCVLALNRDAVTIEALEKGIAERAFAEGWVQPRATAARSGKKVAVVGSGPGGLGAASRLNLLGHDVTVFERDDRPGGLLRYGIPDFKLERQVLERRLAVLEREGVRFRCGVDVGRAPTWTELKATHDAVVVAIGSRRPRELEVPGRELQGVVRALDYLEASNRAVATGEAPRVSAKNLQVVVLGGGDTGSDCLGTALRQGAASVTQVELLPAPPRARGATNPWPEWPMVMRTSTSHEEGGTRLFGRKTTALVGEGGRLAALESVGVRLDDARMVEVTGSAQRLPVDLLILAMGFVGPDASALTGQLGVTLDGRGNVKVDGRFATSVPGVWAVGDARKGASLVVWAIADGRDAAKAIDAALRG